jgi:triosephosphate isomerase
MAAALHGMTAEVAPSRASRIVVAYEPVGAIGNRADRRRLDDAEDMHACDPAAWLSSGHHRERADAMRILYVAAV